MTFDDPAIEGFARATAVTPAETRDANSASDCFRGALLPGWDIFGNGHGGTMQALAAQALLEATGRSDVITITGHFLAPGRAGAVDIRTEVLKQGRQFATARAVMTSDERTLLVVTATLGDLSSMSGPRLISIRPPELPAPEDCLFDAEHAPRFASRVDMRIHPEDVQYAEGKPTGVMQLRGWFRLRDGEAVDSLGLVCAGDAFPPTIFNAGLPPAWTPTLEYTVHVRRLPAPGWLACWVRTNALDNGLLEEDCEIWDLDGNLVAMSRQLALLGK